jgi:hypothetical protein
MTFTLAEALAEIEAALPRVAWQKSPVQPDLSLAKSYDGNADGWRFLIVTWKSGIDPAGAVWNGPGCDGTATKGGLVMRLTPELAKLAGEFATKEQ